MRKYRVLSCSSDHVYVTRKNKELLRKEMQMIPKFISRKKKKKVCSYTTEYIG